MLIVLPLLWSTFLAASLAAPSKPYSFWFDTGIFGAYVGKHFVSFDLAPPQVNFLTKQSCDPEYTFISPRGHSVRSPGPIILDAEGELVWMEDRWGQAMDLRVQEYLGQDFITFWRGADTGTHGTGTYLMLNSSYDVAREVKAANGMEGDLHEFHIIGDKALITVYDIVPADLSSVGGPTDGWIYDGLFQEIDIATGTLVKQWRASEHYKVEDSFNLLYGTGTSKDNAWDFFHINAVDKDDVGNYYISSRYMHSITCIKPSGEVAWILGGKANMFEDLSQGAATSFSWQHHVSWHAGDILLIFDNSAYDKRMANADYSRGLKIAFDSEHKTVSLLQEYVNPTGALSHSQGSVQLRPNGNVFVDWGHNSGYSEFTADGEVVCDAHFGSGAFYGWGFVKSYRGFKGSWVGEPRTRPNIVVRQSWTETTVYVSWNGATEVAHWRLETSDDPWEPEDSLKEVFTYPKRGFETAMSVGDDMDIGKLVRVAALDVNYQVLMYSDLINIETHTIATASDNDSVEDGFPSLQFVMIACMILVIGFALIRGNFAFLARRFRYPRLKLIQYREL